MNKTLSVCCDGESRAMKNVKEILENVLRKRIEMGYNRIFFYDFDDLECMLYDITISLKNDYPNLKRVFCKSEVDLFNHLPAPLTENDFEEIEIVDKSSSKRNKMFPFLEFDMIYLSDCVIYLRISSEKFKNEKISCFEIERCEFIIDKY